MNQRTIICPFCASQVSGESTICPGCQEDLAALAHLEYADMIHYNQALALAKEGRLREAREELVKSLTANRAFGPSYALLAKVYAREGDWEHAKSSIKNALNLLPDDESIISLADEIVKAAAAVPSSAPSPEAELAESEAGVLAEEQEEPQEVNAGPPIEEITSQPAEEVTQAESIPEPEQPPAAEKPKTVSPKSRLITEHADAEDIASLSAPLPWLEKPEKPAPKPSRVPPVSPPRAPQGPAAQNVEKPEPSPQAEQVSYAEPQEAAEQPEAPAASAAKTALREDSIWHTIGMGILLTVGLAILIRTFTGED